jgi:hypothetical protein
MKTIPLALSLALVLATPVAAEQAQPTPNFALLDVSRPEVARLIAAMVQARDAVEHGAWSPPARARLRDAQLTRPSRRTELQ